MNGKTCSVCYEELKITTIHTTKCGHDFCKNCIHRWMARKTSCPICRRDICDSIYTLCDSLETLDQFSIHDSDSESDTEIEIINVSDEANNDPQVFTIRNRFILSQNDHFDERDYDIQFFNRNRIFVNENDDDDDFEESTYYIPEIHGRHVVVID